VTVTHNHHHQPHSTSITIRSSTRHEMDQDFDQIMPPVKKISKRRQEYYDNLGSDPETIKKL
jgi:hypothetical protein